MCHIKYLILVTSGAVEVWHTAFQESQSPSIISSTSNEEHYMYEITGWSSVSFEVQYTN
jgi:hypothetical protein